MIRPATVIAATDLARLDITVPGTLVVEEEAVGREAKVTLYPGRPIRAEDIGPAALVERNAPVVLVFREGGLTIQTDGRALGRGAAGDPIRVMNLSSRNTVSGTILNDGRVQVGGHEARP